MRYFFGFILFLISFNSQAQKKYGLINRTFLPYANKSDDIKICGFYNSNYAYVVYYPISLKNNEIQQQVMYLLPSQKLDFRWENKEVALQNVIIYCYEKSYIDTVVLWLNMHSKNSKINPRLPFNAISAVLSLNEILELSNYEGIKRISISHPQIEEINFVERSNHRISSFATNYPELDSTSLTGNGIFIGEWDGGSVGNHIDLNSNFKVIKASAISQHATHVGGTMAGRGNLNPLYRGMAPNAFVFSWDFIGDIPLEMDTNKNKLKYVLTQNSYGYWTSNCNDFANYDATSTEMDILSNKYTDLLHVYAAGNSRTMNCMPGGYGTILSGFQSAKNTFVVAAVDRFDNEANFSCAGPTKDGRIKPEIAAVGVNVISTGHSNAYFSSNGTSMATPGATGTIALMYEKFVKKNGFTPPNFLAKNIMSNSADDIGNLGPDFKHGFGRINGRSANELVDSNFWKIDSLSNNQNYLDSINIPSGLNQLKVMITWNDLDVNPSSNPILINDLDLIIIDPNGNTFQPWVCNPSNPNSLAIRQIDTLNNIEQVTITNPIAGKYYFKVFGKKISGMQTFSISYFKENKGITVVFPNGNERMLSPSNTANAQIIRWDNKGVIGNYTIQFSRNNGATWTTIATNISNNLNYYTWQNLSDTVSTAQALIKISAGGFEDVSNQVFNITHSITGINTSLCKNQVFIRWNKAKNTQQYHVFQLQNGEMVKIASTEDTSFLVNQLNNQTTYWFALARKGLNGAISQRTNAFSAKPDSTKLPPFVSLDLKDTAYCFNQSYSAQSKVMGSPTINKLWQYSLNQQKNWIDILNTNDSINIKTYINANSFHIRRKYTNICLAPVYTHSAFYQIDTPLQFSFKEMDTIVCFKSVWLDSVSFNSVTKPFVTWYKDSFNQTKIIYSGEQYSMASTIKYPQSIWFEMSNYCETKQSKDLTKPLDNNGLSTYSVYSKPSIQINDVLDACVGETISIQPLLTGGKPGKQTLIIETEDSVFQTNLLSLKILKSQNINLKYFDNCYPDTIKKTVSINMRSPLSIKLNKDSSICFLGKAQLSSLASGGKLPYIFKWNDIGIGNQDRTLSGMQNSQKFIVELTDNCTEKKALDSAFIEVKPPLSVNLFTNKDTLCFGNQLDLYAIPSGGNIASYLPLWKHETYNDYTSNLIAFKSDYYKFKLRDACSPDIEDSIFIYVWDKPNIKIQSMDTLCHKKSVTLNAVVKGGLPEKGVVSWLTLNKTGENVSYTPTSSQDIIVKLSDACSMPDVYDTLWMSVFEPLELIHLKDTNICYGQSLSYSIQSKGGKTNTTEYFWNHNKSQIISFDSFASKSYFYHIKDACLDSQSNSILVNVFPKLEVSPAFINKCSYSDITVEFNANTNRPYILEWLGLDDGRNQTFNNSKTQYYRVNIKDNCSDTSWQNIEVRVTDLSVNFIEIERVFNKLVQLKYTEIDGLNNNIQWWNNQEIETSSSTKQYYFNDYGKYRICRILSDSFGCSDTICIEYDNSNPSKFKQFKVVLYPNPIEALVSFKLNQLCQNIDIVIIDAVGKLIYKDQQNYPGVTEFNIPFQYFSKGVYYLQLTINDEQKVIKFVK
jgi:hypothetical protein